MSAISQLLADADQRPQFISLKSGQLEFSDRRCDELLVRIQQLVVVRKRFVGRQLDCYSLDLRQGSKGTYCSLCPLRRDCHKRLRLLLLVIDEEQEQPAILEINYRSFDSLDQLIERVGRDQLPDTLVHISPAAASAGAHTIAFRELF